MFLEVVPSFRAMVCCCFGIASCFEGMGAAVWSWFLVGSEGNVRQWSLLARRRFRPSVPWCFAVSESPARTSLWRAWELQFGAGFLSVQKATLGSGACLLGAASVLQCHGVLLFQNRPQATESVEKCCFSRISDDTLGSFLAWFWNSLALQLVLQRHGVSPPGGDFFEAVLMLSVLQCHGVLLFRNRRLELRCGAVLRAWELQFGAGFLSVQKATLGSGACLLGAASVLQCHGVLLFRNRPLELRCGAVLRAWELHFGAGFLSQWSLLARRRFRPSVPWCFAVSESPAGNRICRKMLFC